MEPSGPVEEDTNISPNERIMWDHKPDAVYGDNTLSPMMPSKSRKRARSSSPVSSPADKLTTPAVNVKKLAQALKSPHADPTLELWDRYSLNRHETAQPVGLANPALAQLMVSSSPRPSKESASKQVGNLRRTMNYGLGAKRRKIEKSNSGNSGRNSQQEMEAASKSSLVTQLLDTVGSSMHDRSPTEAIEALGEQKVAFSPSPKRKRQPMEEATPCRPSAAPNPARAMSDYGDDDFDDLDLDEDTFLELEACINGTQKMEVAGSKVNTEQAGESFNSLEDINFDLLPGKRAGAAATSKRASPKKHKSTTSPAVEGLLDDLDEDFGDLDDGDIDFDAMELAATQQVQKAQDPTQTVR